MSYEALVAKCIELEFHVLFDPGKLETIVIL